MDLTLVKDCVQEGFKGKPNAPVFMRNLRRTLSLLFIAIISVSTVALIIPEEVADAEYTPPVPQVTTQFINDTLLMTFTSPTPVNPLDGFGYRYKESSSNNWTVFYPHIVLDSYPNSIVLGEVDVEGFRVDNGDRFSFGSNIDFQAQVVLKLYAGKYITGGDYYEYVESGWSTTQTVTVPDEPVFKPSPSPTPTAPPLVSVDWASVDWTRIALIVTILAVAVLAAAVVVLWRKVSKSSRRS